MATGYDPKTNAVYTTSPTAPKRNRTVWIAAGLVLLAIVAIFAFPARDRSATDTTSGTPPVTDQTMPGGTEPAAPAPATPAAPN